jgi:hypothetical protein
MGGGSRRWLGAVGRRIGVSLPQRMRMSQDLHGQPFNLRFNSARRAERDISEFLGLAKGLLADGEISATEADAVHQWIGNHPDASEAWPLSALSTRLRQIFVDGRVDNDERSELAEILNSIVGGTAGVTLGEDAATELPLNAPPPALIWKGATFVFTGKFAFGTRSECQRRVTAVGGACESDVTKRTNYLVIGTFGNRDWIHTSFGRKIEKAVDYRSTSGAPCIIGEQYWAESIERAG